MKKKELIDLINGHWLSTFDDIEEIIPQDVQCVKSGLDKEEGSYDSTCVNVYSCEDGYVGIRSIYSYFFTLRHAYSSYRSKAFEYNFENDIKN
jgi:hypothetical protein